VGKGNFIIELSRLKNGNHNFLFEFGDDLFTISDESLITHGQGKVMVVLSKSVTMVELDFEIEGEVELTCDRSLEKFQYPLMLIEHLILKYGEHWQEMTEELIIIPHNQQEIDLSHFIYEFISVSIPMKKLHPRYANEPITSPLIVPETENREVGTDPRWNELKKLKK